MRRKLVQQGLATLMVSIPAKWAQKNNLGKGDEIEVIEDNNLLVLSSSQVSHENRKEILDVTGLAPLVNRSLISFYIKGADEIEIRFKDQSEIKDFQKRVIVELLGFEIIKQTSSSITVKDVTGSENQNIDELIQRIFLILGTMGSELAQNAGKDTTFVAEMDASINRLTNYCLRILNKKGYSAYDKTSQMYVLVTLLESIGDKYKQIALEKKLSKDQAQQISEITELLKMFKDATFSFDRAKVVTAAKKYDSLKKKVDNILLVELLDTIILLNNQILVICL